MIPLTCPRDISVSWTPTKPLQVDEVCRTLAASRTEDHVKRYATHIYFGRGEVLEVRELDGGIMVGVVLFGDGSQRTIRLLPEYWESDVASLKPKKGRKTREPEREAA